jgi:hypothetical protein
MTKNSIRLVQLTNPQSGRRVALVKEPSLVILKNTTSVYDLSMEAINAGKSLIALIIERLTEEKLDYTAVYEGKTTDKLLPSFDYPANPSACILSGTGLTHKNSALNRQIMHQTAEEKPTDSMQMYQWGMEGGHPLAGAIGVQPEWFYKGTATNLRGHGDFLEVSSFADDGGEEPEIAGIYVVGKDGQPWRIGFSSANEFSDHVMEKKNYLYLAPSKLRTCSIGPEIAIDGNFGAITGTVSIERNGEAIWSKDINSGENNMAHSLVNLEHHHFKYPGHRVAGQAHIHFFGADAFSFGEKLQLQNGDVMVVNWKEMGRSLKNTLRIASDTDSLMQVKSLA